MPLYPHMILTAQHCHEVRSPQQYRAKLAAEMARGRLVRPSLIWREPFLASSRPTVYINDGKWRIDCPCGNCPSVHPDWQMACCFECAAVYVDLEMPTEREAIEVVLLQRPLRATRNWRPPESVTDLQSENLVHGVA